MWGKFIGEDHDELTQDMLHNDKTGVDMRNFPKTRWELQAYVEDLTLSQVKLNMDHVAELRTGHPLMAMLWAELQCSLYWKDIQEGKEAQWNRDWTSKTYVWNEYVRASGNALNTLKMWLDTAEENTISHCVRPEHKKSL